MPSGQGETASMAHPEEARDPSMEEILASIRKIIAEDNPEPSPAAPHLSVVTNEQPAGQKAKTVSAEDEGEDEADMFEGAK